MRALWAAALCWLATGRQPSDCAMVGWGMRYSAIILALSLAACSAAEERADEAPSALPTIPAGEAPAAPSPQPSPAAQPINCDDGADGGFDNAKTCYYAACKQGDPEACRMAESFNGNLDQSDNPEQP